MDKDEEIKLLRKELINCKKYFYVIAYSANADLAEQNADVATAKVDRVLEGAE